MAGMWVVHVDVKDDERYGEYIKESSKVVADHDGEFIARGGRYQQMEGPEFPRNVLVRFPTYERAVEAYESEEYQAILEIAKESSDRLLTILEIDD
ncbi:MAG TPA: DUF1330 domain-containing protein [Acidimicrobiia bacterium]|nr:DUF1330 domain-containing protein [Acidimicrobiia bacterium]